MKAQLTGSILRGERRILEWLLLSGWVTGFWGGALAADPSAPTLRIGFSSTMFSDVNENDARASVKVWGETVAKERRISAHPETMLFRNQTELLEALVQERVDAVGVTILEFGHVREKVPLSPVFAAWLGERLTEQYVLLAPSEGKVRGVRDLVGASMVVQRGPPRLSLAELWLGTLLVEEHLPPLARCAGTLLAERKLSKAVLPVFFGNADACLVTRGGFKTLCELNPQVGNRLTIVASSGEWIPAVFAMRANYQAPFRNELVQGLRELHHTTAGRQVLTVFQSDRLEEVDQATLRPTLDFLERVGLRVTREESVTPEVSGAVTASSP
ncbi:MAG: PhnD/SsuA/transferrin family substrate-binding protein [Verrucomicrobiales bacterium]|nr:PhnD/SsuA/transferrin family substrate-binding protein [Verrucomicrobiales bacterium]